MRHACKETARIVAAYQAEATRERLDTCWRWKLGDSVQHFATREAAERQRLARGAGHVISPKFNR